MSANIEFNQENRFALAAQTNILNSAPLKKKMYKIASHVFSIDTLSWACHHYLESLSSAIITPTTKL